MTKPETKSTPSLRGKTVAALTRSRPTQPVLLKECLLEERGGRLFLVGVSLPAHVGAQEWTDGARRAVAWDAIDEYLLFDTPDDYYARAGAAVTAAPQELLAETAGALFETPHSDEGLPVEPSGIPVDADTSLYVGSTVLAYSQGRWWRAEVVALEADDQVTIHFPGWDSKWDVAVPKTELQVDIHDSLEID